MDYWRLVLINLDNGLFLENAGGWTTDHKLAKQFPNEAAVFKAAIENNVSRAAAARIDGGNQVRGFVWPTISS
jgi:hypothetical protein